DPDIVVGVLFPKITGNELASDVSSQYDGVIVYVTEPASNPIGATLEVDSKGYYYYDKVQNSWMAIGKKYNNIIESSNLIYAQVSRTGTFKLNYPSNNNNTNFANNYLPWNSIEGTPGSSQIKIDSNDPSLLIFPKGHLFRITAMISIVSATKPGYVVTKFESHTAVPLPLSTWGYIETTSEAYQEGGVIYATTVINTVNQEMTIKLNAPVYGHSAGNRGFVLGGSEADDPFYTSYLVVEEL
ncbi:hypothetical protein OIU80_19690, partial [Flavobacterium sp. LS1R47]|nr:hypothetical protein [Flavobacterium frigoritolerans]